MSFKKASQAIRLANQAYHSRIFSRQFNQSGICVMERDWDILLLLDGCRADTFEKLSSINGKYDCVESRGAMTREFLLGNFHERELTDTVYVTANPMHRRHPEKMNIRFHKVIDVWKEDGWDENYNTVLPETMAEKGIAAAKDHPNKRIIIHFLQPHYPFITDMIDMSNYIPDPQKEGIDFWGKVRTGEIKIDKKVLKAAYEQNLEAVLPSVEQILSETQGKKVVTSDHGNLFGERVYPLPIVEWGHPEFTYVKKLTTVPWLEISSIKRRSIYKGRQKSNNYEPSEETEERLRQLGYI